MNLDNTISTPLYKQLEERLRKEIENGELPAGSRLPTENELSERYSVSRVTVRKALDELSKSGCLVRKPGKGTFIAEQKIQRGLSGVLDYSDMCCMTGYTPGAKMIKIALESPTEEEASQLCLEPGQQVLVVQRVRLANGSPTVLETNKFSEEFSFLFNEDLNDASLYQVIRAHKGIVFTQSEKMLEIVFASSQEARYLGIPKRYPLLSIRSLIQDATGTYRHLGNQLCIADRFKMIV